MWMQLCTWGLCPCGEPTPLRKHCARRARGRRCTMMSSCRTGTGTQPCALYYLLVLCDSVPPRMLSAGLSMFPAESDGSCFRRARSVHALSVQRSVHETPHPTTRDLSQAHKLHDVLGNIVPDACGTVDAKRFPLFAEAWARRVEIVQARACPAAPRGSRCAMNHASCAHLQEAGEALFVPSRWYHQVHNITDCVSVNHNWFNAATLNSVCHLLSPSHPLCAA